MGAQNFILKKDISDSLTEAAINTFLASMEETRFKAGERLITRGAKGDTLFIIQEGTCAVIIEKDEQAYPIVLLKAGDFAGEMALITGEPRTAHVDAETDVVAAQISREKFDSVCEEHPALREILSNIVQENVLSSIFREQREVGKYRIQDVLGKHGMSIDYKGVHRFINMPVVIKVLRHDMAMDPEFINKFKEDAVKIVQLNHENIATVYDIAGLYRTIFIFREYFEGDLLSKLLEKTSQLPVNRVVDFLKQVCAGLSYSHEKGLFHQGLNPNNIFISSQDQVKLIDFGLTFPTGAIDASIGERLKYMSPEQLNGAVLDEKSDIYSLGIILFQMVTGQKPFLENDGDNSPERHASLEIQDPRAFCPELPDELYRIIVQSTQKNANKRYQRVSEIMSDLRPLVGN